MTATFVERANTFLALATERRMFACVMLTPTPGCASCLAPGRADAHTAANICEKCAKAGEYLRAATEGPDALRKLADELEDAVSERHEPTSIARLARVVDALNEQVEACIEVAEAMAGRHRKVDVFTEVPAVPYPTGGLSLFSRGIWKAPWQGPDGEMVLVAITSGRRLLGNPVVLPLGADHIAIADEMWGQLDAADPVKRPRRGSRKQAAR